MTVFNLSSLKDAPNLIKFLMRVKFVVLLVFLATKSGLHLRYMNYCPWTLVSDRKQKYTIEQVIHFVGTISDSMVLYLIISLALGYSITKMELSMFELKFLFWLPCTKFFLSQLLVIMASVNLDIYLLFAVMISFDAIALITIGYYMIMTLRSQSYCIRYLRNHVSGNPEAKEAIEK